MTETATAPRSVKPKIIFTPLPIIFFSNNNSKVLKILFTFKDSEFRFFCKEAFNYLEFYLIICSLNIRLSSLNR